MPFSQSLAERVRHALRDRRDIAEKKMFGGLVFLLKGNILAGVWQSSLVVRLGPEQAAKAFEQKFVGPFPATGRPMKGWVFVEPDGIDTDKQLTDWIESAIQFVETLPGK